MTVDALGDRVRALGAGLGSTAPDAAAAAVRRYLDGLSVYQAAREADVSEKRLRRWISELGLKRPDEAAMAMRRAAGRAGAALHREHQREAAALRAAAKGSTP